MRSLQIRSLFARLAFLVDNRGLRDFHHGMNIAKKSMMALSAVVAGGGLVVGKFVKEAAKLEQIKIAFTTMLGSADLAKETLDGLFKFARRTPFEIFGVLGTARILMGMGSSAQELLPQLKMVGDVASGLSVPLEQIALSFGKVQAAGYLTGYELQNLRRAGVPLVRELSAMTGKGREVIQHLVRTRKISFEMFEEAFKRMTSAGGKFNNLMFEQSKTLLGIFINIKDYVKEIVMFTGEKTLPVMKQIARTALEWLKINQKIIQQRIGNVLKKLIKYLADIVGIMLEVVRSFYLFSDIVGGVENALKIMLITMSAIIGLGFATAIGYITKGMWGLAKSIWIAQSGLTLWPTIIGASIIGLLIIIDSLYRYLTGWKGKTLAGWFDEKFLGGKLKSKFEDLKADLIYLKDLLIGISTIMAGLLTGDYRQYQKGKGILELAEKKYKIGMFEKVRRGEMNYEEYMNKYGFASTYGQKTTGLHKYDERLKRIPILGGIGRTGQWINNKIFEALRSTNARWMKELPRMGERVMSPINTANTFLDKQFFGGKYTMGQRAEKALSGVSITINQDLSNVSKEDASIIAGEVGRSITEIIEFYDTKY